MSAPRSRSARSVLIPSLLSQFENASVLISFWYDPVMPEWLSDGRRLIAIAIVLATPVGVWLFRYEPVLEGRVSRPAELHHRPLAEPSVRLSPHSAPIRQTCRSYRSASVQRGPRFLGRAS